MGSPDLRLPDARISAARQRLNPRREPAEVAWVGIVVLLPALVALIPDLRAVDLAYHLRAGADILDTRSLPRVDTYTFSVAGAPWVDQQWGAQVVLASIFRLGDWAALVSARAVLVGSSFGFVYLSCRGRSASVRAASALTLGGLLVASPALALRPQLVALPLFAAGLWAVSTRRRRRWRPWLLPFFAAATANLHGSFTLFPLLAVYAWLDDAVDHEPASRGSLLIVAVTAAATLLNPFGVDIWSYAYDLSTNTVVRDAVTEWAPVSITTTIGALAIASFVAVAAVLVWRRRRVRWTDVALAAVFLVLAATAIRGVLWWSLVAPVVLAPVLSGTRPSSEGSERQGRWLPTGVVIGTLSIGLLLFLPWWREGSSETLVADAPPGVTRAVAELGPGSRLFAHQPWASWFEFAVPDALVFVDSRVELFPTSVWVDYSEVAFARARWREVLARWNPDAIVAEHERWPLIRTLREDPGWRVAFEDDDGVLFVRV